MALGNWPDPGGEVEAGKYVNCLFAATCVSGLLSLRVALGVLWLRNPQFSWNLDPEAEFGRIIALEGECLAWGPAFSLLTLLRGHP